jgi:hypothetical protein
MRKLLGNFIWWSLRKADTKHRLDTANGWRNMTLDEAIEDMAKELADAVTETNDLNEKLHKQDATIAILKAEIQHFKQLYTPTTLAITAKTAPRSSSKPRRGGSLARKR